MPTSQAPNKPSALLDETIESTAQGVVVFDADERLVTFNRQYADLFEFPQGFLKRGMPIADIIRSRAERGMYADGDPEAVAQIQIERTKLRLERTEERTLANGTVYIYHHKPMTDGGFVKTYTDITERKRAEREAAEKSQLLETTFQNMIQGIAVFDRDHRLVAFNPQFISILNLPPDFLRIGMSRRSIIQFRGQRGDYSERDAEDIVKEGYETSNYSEKRIAERTLPNGTVYVYHRRPLPGGGYVVTYTDITERKEMERQLRASEERFRGAFDNAGIGIFIRSADGKSREYNRAFCEMMGYSVEEMRSMRMRDIAHPDDDPERTSIRYVSFGDMDTQTIERRFVRKDGEVIWCTVNYKSVYDAGGSPLSTIGMFQEITDQKRAEQEIAEKSRLLENTINTMAQGYVYYDADLRLVAFNTQYEEMFGHTPGFLHAGLALEDVVRDRGHVWLDRSGYSQEDR
ncbi:MAG TPA: PAS-domain containing protein, partial [Alphaproteobacteria bacterium]|nr:PAS-domain containing protein [Alphaproteobacteria bacterium]